jgi:hypothetical protein
MFDSPRAGIGLWPGEGHDDTVAEQQAYELTCRLMDDDWAQPGRHVLPDDLEEIPVGPFLAAIAGSVDRTRLNGHDAVRIMQIEARLSSHFEAGKLASMSEVAFCPPGGPNAPVERSHAEIEYAAVEIAAALSLTRRSAEFQRDEALCLTGRLGRVWQRFSDGDLDAHRVRAFHQQLGHHDREVIDAVLDRVLDDGTRLTAGQLRARLARQVMAADPEGADAGYREGLGGRRVVSYPNPDFTASLTIGSAPPHQVAAAMRHVDLVARSLVTDREERSLDSLRADVALDLLQGKCHCGVATIMAGGVHLNVDLATLAELADEPGEIAGYGPVHAYITRQIALDQIAGEWTYRVVDDHGQVVAAGITRRRPSASQRRRVQAEYESCIFVGCRMPSYDCDLDHRKPFSRCFC